MRLVMMDTEHEPSPGYLINLAAACAGIAFAGMGLWAALAETFAGDQLDNFETGSVISEVLAFALAFSERATRWNRLELLTRQTVLAITIAVFLTSLLATVVCLSLIATRLGFPDIATIFGVLAALWQISTRIWFGRLRRGQ